MKPSFNSVDWIDFLRYLYKKSTQILVISFIITVLTAGISLLIEDQYKSTANLLPNTQRSIGLSFLQNQGTGNIGAIASTVLGGGQSQIINRFYILLESNNTREKVVKKLNLIEHYGTQNATYPLKAAKQILSERSSFQGKEEGNFIIEVWDKDPKMAKKIADYYVKRLNKLNNKISTKEATEYFKFIKERYKKAQQNLDSLRKKLTAFQEKYGIYQLPQQASGYFSLLATVTQQKIKSEIKLELLDKTVKKQSNIYQQSRKKLQTITKKLDELYHDKTEKNIILNFERLPELGARYFNLKKGLEIQEQIQKTLLPLYEKAKMQKAKALPLVITVDDPEIPKEESWPPRLAITILGGLTAFILSIIYYLIKLNYINNKDYYKYIVK